MKQCKCEHWQTCPSCYPQGFDAEGARLPPQPTPLEAAKNQIAQLEQDLQSTADVLGGKDFELQNVIGRNKELELCIARRRHRRCGAHTEVEIHQITVPSPSSQERVSSLETELAATQAQLKEARDALRSISTDTSHVGCRTEAQLLAFIQGQRLIAVAALSRPADTTALNRYVAAELRRIADYWNGALHSAHLRKQADELESTK